MDTPTTIQEAARGLRAHLGLSQQAMATALALSMGALRNYESGVVSSPEARPLYAYLIAAERNSRPDLGRVFRAELYKVLAIPDSWDGLGSIEPRDDLERCNIAAMLASLRGEAGFERFREPLWEALEGPRKLLIERLRRHGVWKVLGAKPQGDARVSKRPAKEGQ